MRFMSIATAALIFDSGFSQEVLSKVRQIAGYFDLITGFYVLGDPFLSAEQRAQITPARSQDPFNHGTVILNTFCEQLPDCPVYLARVVSPTNNVLRTVWHQGEIVQAGWTEAHLACVQHAIEHGMQTVGSFSWGGYESAMDDTGWERFQLGKVIGPGMKGHVVVAAAGEGTPKSAGGLKSRHASWTVSATEETTVRVFQATTAEYNLWANDAEDGRSTDSSRDWKLSIWRDGQFVQEHHARYLGDNLWNGKQQLSFAVVGRGNVEFRLTRWGQGRTAFNCWIKDGAADFRDHQDPVEVIEPAVFSNVIAVGLNNVDYSPTQGQPGGKPEVILEDDQPHRMLSFHVPEVAIRAVSLLRENAMDCHQLQVVLQAEYSRKLLVR